MGAGIRVWALLLATLCCLGSLEAQSRLRCSIRASTVFGPDAEDFDDITVFGDDCDNVEVSTEISTDETDDDDDFLPFVVPGGDDGVETEDSEEEVVIQESSHRPAGPWAVLIESEVHYLAHEAWIPMQNFGNVLAYGLEGVAALVRSMDTDDKRWVVDLESGEHIQFVVTETNDENYYHVARIESHGPNVFPGVDISGSRVFIQFSPKPNENTLIEFGWGGSVEGEPDVAVIAVTALGQEWLVSLEDKFGETCVHGKNIRTIEGDCNNLAYPRRGAAGHALVRLGDTDPSFPDGDPTKPSGPVHISPREISNRLCSQSPGVILLEENSYQLEGECFEVVRDDGQNWEICPYDAATMNSDFQEYAMLWNGTSSLEDGTMGLHFSGEDCELELILTCGGIPRVMLMDDPCGNKGNRFFHPLACLVRPGEDDVLQSSPGLTDLFWTFGQFIDHDLGLTPVTEIADKNQPGFSKNSRSSDEELPISIPSDDYYFNETEMEFERTTLFKDRRRGLHENQHSSYADLGQVYGLDYLRARALRSFSGGKLKVSEGNLPPFNKISGPGALRAKVDNAPDAGDHLFAVGDIRGNEQTLLLAMHIIWMREHNKVCDELAAAFPKWHDERLYQTARAIVIAEYQSIVYDEWLPLLLGEGVVPSSDYVYDANIDPSIMAIFSTAAFRFGHTMVGSYLWRLGPGPREKADLELVPLRKVFFEPELVEEYGIDDFLRGGAWHHCKEVDSKVVDELRNFLFTEDENKGHLDLVALNIQRGRDMGLPSFNAVRDLFGLKAYATFYDFIDDEHLAAASERVYEYNVDQCDALYGGFAETPFPGAIVGETFHVIIKDQFTKIRDGDRFFFRGLSWDLKLVEKYPRLNDIMDGKVKLVDIIVRNCGITYEELGPRTSGTIMKL